MRLFCKHIQIYTLGRAERPVLTLSYEIVAGQEPWGDRPSVCEGEVGSPAGYFVVEILSGGSFVEYSEWWALDNVTTSTECGTNKTTKFVFQKSALGDLNNTQIRCAVRNSEAFIGEDLPVSDAKIIRVVSSKCFIGLLMFCHRC